MGWRAKLDRKMLPIARFLAERSAPPPETLPHPLFSTMIRDRSRRWKTEREPNPYSAIANKVDGQTYMRSLGHAVPEVYGVYPSLEAIPRFEDLPRNFVLKPVKGWSAGGVFVMRDGVDWMTRRRLSRDELVLAAKAFAGDGHKAIRGPWMAEELLFDVDGTGTPAPDYKFFCFGPKVAAIQIAKRTSVRTWENRNWFRDPAWRPLPVRLKWDLYPDPSPLAKPAFWDEMLKMASDVGGRLNVFMRIDCYATDRGPVFGEFTGYPSLGKNFTPRGDIWLGSHWQTRDGGA